MAEEIGRKMQIRDHSILDGGVSTIIILGSICRVWGYLMAKSQIGMDRLQNAVSLIKLESMVYAFN